METAQQARKAEQLRKLHKGPRILILANAWDVISARIVEDAGFPAVATTSAGVAAVLGYPDGQRVPQREVLEFVARIARAVSVPVTADMESGYGTSPADMAEMARALVDAGAVGLNLEDVTGDDEGSHVEIGLQTEKIAAVREASAAAGVPLVINARTDVYLMPIGPEETRFERTVERLRAYRKAGADCVFAPGIRDKETIGKLVRAVDGPLNILLQPGGPSVADLEKLGVARASIGSGTMRAALGTARKFAKALSEYRDHAEFMKDAVPYDEVNRLLGRDS
ncbi:MAG TPA: isocitrate lyase/phosphoenolpyruvate mutase family protein [Candidatus Acidoferrum sp.]